MYRGFWRLLSACFFFSSYSLAGFGDESELSTPGAVTNVSGTMVWPWQQELFGANVPNQNRSRVHTFEYLWRKLGDDCGRCRARHVGFVERISSLQRAPAHKGCEATHRPAAAHDMDAGAG